MNAATGQLLTELLPQVSRSFYLTLRVLPRAVRQPIALAYLLARASDTIADTGLVSLEQRLDGLCRLRNRILARASGVLNFGPLAELQGSPHERLLLERIEDALSLLQSSSAPDRERIQEVLQIIISGQELDLRRFATANAKNIVALNNDDELDDYTYRVAGCVGQFWTRICRAHLFPGANIDQPRLLADAVRFGKGLQLVNILRDLPADLRQGRCYIPAGNLGEIGLPPASLLLLENDQAFRPLYNRYLGLAESHLAAGWEYTNNLPAGCVRVRLACAWPILIGVRTLKLLRRQNVLDASQRIKVSRKDVRQLLTRSVLLYPWKHRWRRLFEEEMGTAP